MSEEEKNRKCNHCDSDNTSVMMRKGLFNIYWPQYVWCYDCEKEVDLKEPKNVKNRMV